MGRFLRYLLGTSVSLVANAALDVVYAVLCAIEFVACGYLTYTGIFAPMAAAPGSRDGPGLIFVGLVLLVGVIFVATMLASATKALMRSILPDWENVLID